MKRPMLILATVVASLAACSGGSHHASPTTTSRGAVSPTVVPSSACDTAISPLAGIRGTLDPFQGIIPSGLAARSFESAISKSLTACSSRQEWIAAARSDAPYTDAISILKRFCAARFTDRPRIIPLTAPSCVRVARPVTAHRTCRSALPGGSGSRAQWVSVGCRSRRVGSRYGRAATRHPKAQCQGIPCERRRGVPSSRRSRYRPVSCRPAGNSRAARPSTHPRTPRSATCPAEPTWRC